MRRKQINIDTIKALLARSGNKCSFRNCDHPIFDDNNLYVANLCHIEAVSPNGPRYNSQLSVEKINSFENLLFLCYRHHKEIDNIESYTVEKLKVIKAEHEKRFYESRFSVKDELLLQITEDINKFWRYFDNEMADNHEIPELKFDINSSFKFDDLYNLAHQSLDNIEFLMGSIDKKVFTDNFEALCLGLPNNMMQLTLLVDHMRIKYLEELLKLNVDDKEIMEQLEIARNNYLELSKIAARID